MAQYRKCMNVYISVDGDYQCGQNIFNSYGALCKECQKRYHYFSERWHSPLYDVFRTGQYQPQDPPSVNRD